MSLWEWTLFFFLNSCPCLIWILVVQDVVPLDVVTLYKSEQAQKPSDLCPYPWFHSKQHISFILLSNCDWNERVEGQNLSKSSFRIAKITHHCLNCQFSLLQSFHLLSLPFFPKSLYMSVIIVGVVVVFVYMLEFKSDSATLALNGHAVWVFITVIPEQRGSHKGRIYLYCNKKLQRYKRINSCTNLIPFRSEVIGSKVTPSAC